MRAAEKRDGNTLNAFHDSNEKTKSKEEKASKGQVSAPISQVPSSKVSTKDSSSDIPDYSLGQISLEDLKKELAFPTHKWSGLSAKRGNKRTWEVFKPLDEGSLSEARRGVAALQKVLETLEEELIPIDFKSSVNDKKPLVLMSVPATSTLLRARKSR